MRKPNPLLLCLLAIAGATGWVVADTNQAPQMLTVEQWRADLAYLVQQMPLRHKNLYHTMTREAFAAAAAQLNDDIPHLNDDEITVRLMMLAAMPTDSHTGLQGYPQGEAFPLRLRHYADGLYVESAATQYADAVGGRVLRIGNADAEDAYQRILPLLAHDTGNPGLLEAIAPALLMSGHVLHGLDIEPSAGRAEIQVRKDGATRTYLLAPTGQLHALFGHVPIAGWVDARAPGKVALWLSHPDRRFWYAYDPAHRLFYVQLNAVLDSDNQTLADFFEGAFAKAAALPLDKFVLDLRMNDGGNNGLTRPIVVGLVRLQTVDKPGHLFVVISRNTYSAAQNLVNRIELYTDVIFVGQPTGEHVNSYGDAAPRITLPNSRLPMGAATVWWQDMSERDKRIETDPEIAADPTFADYVANRDPALTEILAYTPEDSLEDTILNAIKKQGVDGAVAAYRAYAARPIHRYIRAQMESRLNTLGYVLLGKRDIPTAIDVFAVNVRANPNSANASDSLGDGYLAAGERVKAIESYERALSIDPNFQSSRASLKRLGVSAPDTPH